MVEIVLTESHSGYEAVAEYIRRYWKHNVCDAVICSIATSFDGKSFETRNEVAMPYGFDGDEIEFLYDWWEGERFIKLFGIKGISEINIEGGIYTEE